MSWITWFLFESQAALGAVLFTANFVLLVYWRRSGRARPLLAGLAIAVGLLAIQSLVVTRREHALRVLRGIEEDVVAAQTVNLAAALSADFEAGGKSAAEFVALVARQYTHIRVRELKRGRLGLQASQRDRFDVEVAYQANISADQLAGWVRTRWQITFRHTALGWQIAHVEPTYIDGILNPSWDRLDLH